MNKKISSEDLNDAYKKIIDTGLFKSVKFKQSNQNLIITVEEYPTVNLISFEGNKKFTDEKLSSFLKANQDLFYHPKFLRMMFSIKKHIEIREEFQLEYNQK